MSCKKRLERELHVLSGEVKAGIMDEYGKSQDILFQELTLKHGKALYRSLIEWCEDSVKTLDNIKGR